MLVIINLVHYIQFHFVLDWRATGFCSSQIATFTNQFHYNAFFLITLDLTLGISFGIDLDKLVLLKICRVLPRVQRIFFQVIQICVD